MATDIRVPTLGKSVTEATIGRWFKKPGEPVKADEPLVELETDKVTLEVNAPAAGVLGDIVAKDGETVGRRRARLDRRGRRQRREACRAGRRQARRRQRRRSPPRRRQPRSPRKPPPRRTAARRWRGSQKRAASIRPASPLRPARTAGSTKGDMLAAIAAGTAAPAAAAVGAGASPRRRRRPTTRRARSACA